MEVIDGLRQIAAEIHAAHMELSEDNRRAMMDGYDEGAFHSEQLQIQHDIEDVILKSMRETLTDDDARLLAWASGINIAQLNMNRKDIT